MRFQVPQFIEVEDKMFGPLSFKQFVYIAGGIGFGLAIYTMYGIFIAVIVGAPVMILALALAFFNYNGRPFIASLESASKYFTKRKLYLWKKADHEKKASSVSTTQAVIKPYVPRVSESKLKELAWSLDIKESLYSQHTADTMHSGSVANTMKNAGDLENLLGHVNSGTLDDRDTIHFERRNQ